jgi:hypothetical protein
VVLCVLRVLVYDLNRAKDLYLLSNCAAILLNLASQVMDDDVLRRTDGRTDLGTEGGSEGTDRLTD